ncbi:MAG: adenosine deaminase [Parcubacteria group bacterium]|jgi:adenosine deaminase
MTPAKGQLDKYSKNILREDLVDLHIHVGGAMSPHILWEIAQSQGIKPPARDYWSFCNFLRDIDSFEDLLNVYEWTDRIQSSPKAIESGIYNVISKEYRSANVSTIELRFNPMFRTRGSELDMDHIINSAIHGMERAMFDYGVRAGLIFCLDRRLSFKHNEVIVKKAIAYRKRGVVGVDIAGPEAFTFRKEKDYATYRQHFRKNVGVKIADPSHLNFEEGTYFNKYVALFSLAREKGLGITVHTGETKDSSVERVMRVVEAIKPDRIGHGIRTAYDKNAMDLLKKHDVVLEICPTINVMTGSVASWEEMHWILRTFLKNEVKFTINTDAPYLGRTGLAREYRALYERKILNKKELEKCLETSRKASFIR